MIATLMLFAGWSLMAASQPKQVSRIVRHAHLSGGIRIGMRSAGTSLQLFALVLLVRTEGPSFGPLVWACLLSISAMAVALILAWLPRFTAPTLPSPPANGSAHRSDRPRAAGTAIR